MTSNAEPTKTVPQSPATTAQHAGDVERQTPATGSGVPGILGRWRREDLLKKGSLVLRAIGFMFSLLAFIVMASNSHGGWEDFGKYEEYRYVLAIAILSTLYTGAQALRQVQEMSTGKQYLPARNMALVDFFGDQIVAYLLLSAASSAIPITNRMRQGADNIFTDSSAAAISMEILAFLTLAFSALISGYKLSNTSYI